MGLTPVGNQIAQVSHQGGLELPASSPLSLNSVGKVTATQATRQKRPASAASRSTATPAQKREETLASTAHSREQ